MMDFENISYLNSGNPKQRLAYEVLTKHCIFEKLREFEPLLTGTIPIAIDIEGSDLDVICCFSDAGYFMNLIRNEFGSQERFTIRQIDSISAVVASFVLDNFKIELFGQALPVKQQFAYRHMLIEQRLLERYGEIFRKKVIELKEKGYKTEPAFALLLGLEGNPYEELLKFESEDF
jgi:hypothetical protein